MVANVALVLYYTKTNKYSFNALLGALETKSCLDTLQVYFAGREDELAKVLKSVTETHAKTVVGISFFTTQLWDMYRMMKSLRGSCGNQPIYVAGGPHPTGDPLGTLDLGFDIVVRGEGEETFSELLQKIVANEEYRTIKGIAFIDDKGEFQNTGRRPWVDLNEYPPFSVKYNKFGHIEITRGCPFVCAFCQTPQIQGGHPRHRSIDRICEFVQKLKDSNLTDLRFITPNAFSYGSQDGKSIDIPSLERLLSSVNKIIRPNGRIFFGSFPSEVRPEHVVAETLDLVLKYADNDNLIIGAQSGSQRMLDICHRGHTVNDVYKAVELTRKAGLVANVDFMFGLPGETQEDIGLSLRVMSDLVGMGARIHAHTFMPLPQTPFARAPAGRVSDDVKAMIGEFIPGGIVYGDWREQEQIAKKIAMYLNGGKLRG